MNVYLSALGYLADVVILGTYALMLKGRPARWFHYGNGLGAAPLIAIEVLQRAWPIVPITATFGVLGWYGVWTTRNHIQLADAPLRVSPSESVAPSTVHYIRGRDNHPVYGVQMTERDL